MAITFPDNPELNEVTATPAGPYYWNGKSWCSGMPAPKPALNAPAYSGRAVGQIHSVQRGTCHVWDGKRWHYVCDTDDFMGNEEHYRAQAKAMI